MPLCHILHIRIYEQVRGNLREAIEHFAEVIVGYDGLRPEALSQPLQWHTMHKTYGEIQTTTRLAVAKPWSTLARSYGGLGNFKEEKGSITAQRCQPFDACAHGIPRTA
jgi:hypothetical protein